ncbi:M23 family metallopeptidase [Arcobacter sp. 15-2]|uniref:M23 family metallopeptidase n=1 Tax=Arcobacter sp. 15-2 TaxID=3374109 RepID=UPI00399CDC04
MTFKKNRNSPLGIIISVVIIAIIIGVAYLYLSPAFEQNKPTVESKDNIYWNLKSPVEIKLKDDSGIKYYKVTFKDGAKDIVLAQEVMKKTEKEITLSIKPPKLDMFYKGQNTTLEVEVVDNSKWNFLEGNKVIQNIDVSIDTKKPIANVLGNSRYIQRGGSAVVVVKVQDENLKDAYISFNDIKNFKLTPYHKENYYVALVAWPMDITSFNRVNLIVTDKADNKTITKVPFYIQRKTVKNDNITVSEKFIKNVSASVLEQSFEKIPDNLEDIFIYSNRELREKNVKTIEQTIEKNTNNRMVESFNIKAFKRLRGSKTVAGYGDRRHYYLNGEKINEAWHLGIDWASVKKAPVRVSNDGIVVFKNYLGLYGNSIIIDHGMGLATLYAHTSSQQVDVGETVSSNQKIAHTGATGAVFGDHLHFGVLIQGVEVNPIEWMDRNWIKVRITDILKQAKKDIDGK